MSSSENKILIGNCSGFYGDRLSAAKDMVEGGPVDVLTGDYLAELTMAILYNHTTPGHGKSTTIRPFTPDCLHFFKNLFSPY